MTALVQQRQTSDCGICCIAMLTSRPYEDVLAAAGDNYDPAKGMRREYEVLQKLGYDYRYDNGEPKGQFICMHREWSHSAALYRRMIWGRRALVSVPSLNLKDAWHMVYWDGTKVWDPSTGNRYENFNDLKPREIIIFKEGT